MDIVNQAVSYLNAHPEDIVALSSALSVVLLYGINRITELSKLTNGLLGILALPGMLAAVGAYLTNLHFLSAYPLATAVLGQLIYHLYEALKRNVASKALAPVASAPTFLDEPVAAVQTVDQY